MAVRIKNTNKIDFGDVGGSSNVTITHFRVTLEGDVFCTVALTTPRTIAPGEEMAFAADALQIVVANGTDGVNAGLEEMVKHAFASANAVKVKLMTSATAEVAVSGYSEQDWDNFTITTE